MSQDKKENRITCLIALMTAVVLYVVDYISKALVSDYYNLGDSFDLFPYLLEFRYTHNYGAAFGILQNQRELFLILTVVLLGIGLWLLLSERIKNPICVWAFALILCGGFGNMTDRIFNTGGYVVDFLCFKFQWFPYIFKIADICVVVGGAFLIWYLIIDLMQTQKNQKKASDAESKSDESMTAEEFFSSEEAQ